MYETELQLRFGDTDAMGHVNNAKVLTYLELGRIRFFTDVMGAKRVEDIRFILAEVSCRYRIPILLHDRVFVRMHITDVHRDSFRFRCDLYDPRDGRVFVEAETVQVMYEYETGRPVPVDADFLARARDYIGRATHTRFSSIIAYPLRTYRTHISYQQDRIYATGAGVLCLPVRLGELSVGYVAVPVAGDAGHAPEQEDRAEADQRDEVWRPARLSPGASP